MDQLGNRLSQAMLDGNLPGAVGVPTTPVNLATNCIDVAGYQCDNAGNMIATPGFTYAYDGANRLTGINGANMYTYFGPLRIKKVVGSTTTVYIYSGTKPIVEYVNGSLSREYVYSGSTLLATISGGITTYHHPDHLSNRAETDSTGAPVRTFGQLPYGEVWYETGTADKLKFTSYERDSAPGETGLDYAMFRHYSPGLGRFMSADLLAGHVLAPQSLSRYAYPTDPINNFDPLGLECTGIVGWDTATDEPIFGPVPCTEKSGEDDGTDRSPGVGSGSGGDGMPGDPCYGLPCGDGGPNHGGGGGPASPATLKDWLYKNFQAKINDCIKQVFGKDASKIPPQTRANAPILNANRTQADITQSVGRPAWGTNDPFKGPNGTVYITNELYHSSKPYAPLAIIGAFVHELGNILDGKYVPTGPADFEMHHGVPTSAWDKDTGANFQKCVFGTIWTPTGKRDDLP